MIKGDRLKALRKSVGYTQTELGELLGVKKSVVCLYEKELRNPSIENIAELVQIFGVDADYLIGTDCLVKTKKKGEEKIYAMTKEEVTFINELKKNKMLYDILLQDPKRGIDLLKTKIGQFIRKVELSTFFKLPKKSLYLRDLSLT